MNKKYLSLILALIMLVSTFSVAFAAPTNNEKVNWLVEKGIVKGDAGTGNLRLGDTISRAEAAAMIARVQGLEVLAEGFKGTENQFKDVPTTHWANGYINVVASNKIVNGYPDGTFRPENKITYAEIIKMLVVVDGGILETNPLVSWEVPYITKALEVGILDDITIKDYDSEAIREIIFEMVYNVMSKEAAIGLESYKGIVIENTRVSGLDKDEIAIEVIKRNSETGSFRYDHGNNVRIKLSKVTSDTNMLLGKVIDVTIDKNNEASRLTIDNSYSYLTGSTIVNKDELTINGKTYGVSDTNRFTNTTDKLVAVFHNDTEYRSMKDYFEKVGNSKEFNTEFSNVTMEGNMILFIDSFDFEDIAIVKETFKSGEEVHIYRDDNNGSVTRFNPNSILSYTEAGFESMEYYHIRANDVIHIYDRDKAIVRIDSVKKGDYQKFKVGADHSYVQIDNKDYVIIEATKKRPVYSLDGTRFFTLFPSRGDLDLDPLRGERVTLTLDVKNELQSLTGNIKYDEGIFVVEDSTRKTANVIGPNNGISTIVEETSSVLNYLGSNVKRDMEDFYRGDLVYLIKKGSKIDRMVRMETADNIIAKAKPVVKSPSGSLALSKTNIRLEEPRNLTSNFQINNANIFVIEEDGNTISKITGTDLDNIIKNVKPNSDLKAHVISNKDFNIMDLGNGIRYGNEADVAHTIIFTNFENSNVNLTREVLQATYKYSPNRDNVIEGKDQDGITIKRTADRYSNLPTIMPGDIVELALDKDKLVHEAIIKIQVNSDKFTVVELESFSSNRARKVILEDSKKVKHSYYISKDLLRFGDVREDKKISFSLNSYGDIDVIVVR